MCRKVLWYLNYLPATAHSPDWWQLWSNGLNSWDSTLMPEETIEILFSKNWYCVFWPEGVRHIFWYSVAPWRICSVTCLCFTYLRACSEVKDTPGKHSFKELKSKNTGHKYMGQGIASFQVSSKQIKMHGKEKAGEGNNIFKNILHTLENLEGYTRA